jgi:hypothetical protein
VETPLMNLLLNSLADGEKELIVETPLMELLLDHLPPHVRCCTDGCTPIIIVGSPFLLIAV